MKYQVKLAESAVKYLKKLPAADKRRILDQVDNLTIEPRPHGSLKLKSSQQKALYRIRCGNYRIVYAINDDILTVLVVEIGHRKDIYQNM